MGYRGKVRLGSVQVVGLVDHLGEEAVGFPFPGKVSKLKVRLGSVQVVGLVDHLGEEAVGFPLFFIIPRQRYNLSNGWARGIFWQRGCCIFVSG